MSPFANLVNTLDVTPPGAAAIIITPKAISGVKVIKFINIKAIIGSKITWHINPTRKFFGYFITLKKSFIVKPRPKLNIIMAKQRGAIFVTISIK